MITSSYSKKIFCHFHDKNEHTSLFKNLEDLTIFLTTGNKNYVYFEEETLLEHKNKFDRCYESGKYNIQKYITDNEENEIEYSHDEYSWNMDILNEKNFTLDNNEYKVKKGEDGEDVDVYVFDSIIDNNHESLKNKVKTYTIFGNESFVETVGHGTHVANTVAGKYYGIAKNINLHSVKVCEDEACPYVLESLVWFLQEIAPKCKRCVINISLGGPKFQIVDSVVYWPQTFEDFIINHISQYYNVIFVVAAGNEGLDITGFVGGYSCLNSPAGAKEVITVGAFNKNNEHSVFSSWGDCVDVYAPGEEVISAKIHSFNKYVKWAGTSMATPHVSGSIGVLWSNNLHLNSIDMKYKFLRYTLDADFENLDTTYFLNEGNRLYLQEEFEINNDNNDNIDGWKIVSIISILMCLCFICYFTCKKIYNILLKRRMTAHVELVEDDIL
jgi:subtilisin family serine protease